MTRTRISTVPALLVAVLLCSAHSSPTWNPLKGTLPPTILKPILLPVPHARAALSPELLNLLQNPESNPSYSPPNNNGLSGTPAAPFPVYPPSILNQFSNLFNAPSQMPAPRVPQPRNGDPAATESDSNDHSSTVPTSDRPSSSADPLTDRHSDPYPVESFPAPPTPRAYSPIRTGPATVVPFPPSPQAPPPTAPVPSTVVPFADSTLLPIQPLSLSPNLREELIKFLSAAGLTPPTTLPSQELINNGNTNQIVEPGSDDLQSKTSPLSPSPSTPPPPPPAQTASKQSPEPRPDQPENPLLSLMLNSQSPINLLNSFLSLSAPNTPTTTTQAPNYIKRSLNPSFIKYLSTLPKFQQPFN